VDYLSVRLSQKPLLLNAWCFIAAFGAYFCTYAFRKPFFTAQFDGYVLWGMGLKSVYIIMQVLGYMSSKFIGVKIISELQPDKRIKLVVSLISIAGLALLFFAWVPAPYNLPFLFINGLPLGMVWGVLFSFLEGRRFTEILGIGLSINMIMTSGILKSVYLYIQGYYGFSEFWMPFVVGVIFLPAFALFVWMLSEIPPPNKEEQLVKVSRKPMNNAEKVKILSKYGFGILTIILVYAFFTTLRDFRDNFAVEIWHQIDSQHSKLIFAKTETIIASVVMVFLAFIAFFKNNRTAYYVITIMIVFSLLSILLSNFLFRANVISPQLWMTTLGIGFYLPYLLVQIAYFERLIAYQRIKGNAGFFVYLCDSVGYLGSVVLLFNKEFSEKTINYSQTLLDLSEVTGYVGILLIAIQFFFFEKKYSKLKDYEFSEIAR
jgi:MFS family permease